MIHRVIVCVDHEIGFRLLTKIIELRNVGQIDIVHVYTTKDNGKLWWPGVYGICNENNVSCSVYDRDVDFQLDNVDWAFLLSWKHVMSDHFIKSFSKGVINLHYSLLPDLRGVYPVNWAIIKGYKYTGVSYHLVDSNIDRGPLICQEKVDISFSDTARTLQLKLDDVAYRLFDKVLVTLNEGAIDCKVLDEGVYCSRKDYDFTNELLVDELYTGRTIWNLMRGKAFFPDTKNMYVRDPVTGSKVYFSLNIIKSEGE